jgi:hypothetical protein
MAHSFCHVSGRTSDAVHAAGMARLASDKRMTTTIIVIVFLSILIVIVLLSVLRTTSKKFNGPEIFHLHGN